MYIDQELCKKCLECQPVCPMEAIIVKDKTVFIDYEACVECGVCVERCPFEVDAIAKLQQAVELFEA